mgnify:CR=1 FL=1
MFILKEFISNLTPKTNKVVNKDISIKNGVVYINNGENEYKYENDCYFIKADTNWVNMQGGIPFYEAEENFDNDLFIEKE